jgi:hypothetical protein
MVLAAAADLRGGRPATARNPPEVVMVPAKVEPDFGRSKPALLSSRLGRLSFRLVQGGDEPLKAAHSLVLFVLPARKPALTNPSQRHQNRRRDRICALVAAGGCAAVPSGRPLSLARAIIRAPVQLVGVDGSRPAACLRPLHPRDHLDPVVPDVPQRWVPRKREARGTYPACGPPETQATARGTPGVSSRCVTPYTPDRAAPIPL